MHNGELAKKYCTSLTFETKRMSSKARCVVLVKQMFHTWMKTCCIVGLVKLKEPMHSTQTQSARVKEKNIFYLLVTIVATLQDVRINAYFILISKSSPYIFRYRSIYSQVNTVGYFCRLQKQSALEFFSVLNIRYTFRSFEQLSLALKNRVAQKFFSV